MDARPTRFIDRSDAGRQLAARLLAQSATTRWDRPVVYALPRGGVPVALEIARALDAPLDLVMVRKIGAPGNPEVAIGAVVDGESAQTIVNEDVRRGSGASDAFFERARLRELAEIERRRSLYLEGRPHVEPAGCTAIVVDDGLATGATAKAAIAALRRQGAAKIILALPVAPQDALADVGRDADLVVCLHSVRHFAGVGAFYTDFDQLTDEQTIGMLRTAWSENLGLQKEAAPDRVATEVTIPPHHLAGTLTIPAAPRGIILFAHGSGSSRHSPRNHAVADALNAHGFATLLLDLLTEAEARDRRHVFDIPLLAERLLQAVLWINGEQVLGDLKLGLFGASTGAGAALVAAAKLGERVGAVVSRGGRPDLAGPSLVQVKAPTLLIVGENDTRTLSLNQQALATLRCEKLLKLVPGAGHVFEEPGTLETVMVLSCAWFEHALATPRSIVAKPAPRPPQDPAAKLQSAVTVLRAAAKPLPAIDDPGFAEAFDGFGTARIVLLGEASHGTSEFYRARAAITRRLIERHGFSIVAVEADWPDAAAIDRYVRQRPHRPVSASPFTRFPTWMWRNNDVHDFVAYLRSHNAKQPQAERVGFYGLDLYNMTASMAAVLAYLDRVDPAAAAVARQRYSCLSPWSREPAAYGKASINEGYGLCEQPVVRNLIDLLQKELRYMRQDGDDFLDAVQNARLVTDAERYYRIMYYGSHESWNLRDRHMFETLQHVLDAKHPGAKAVVWAHNSHIGDARFTDMGTEHGELNIGQLCRQHYGNEAALIGFGTHAGSVAAASEWDAPMEIKTVRPSRSDSHEALFHQTGIERFLLNLGRACGEDLRELLAESRLERYIGVIYRPETERWSHYSHASLARQYDAYVWFDETRAVTPLPTRVRAGEDEMYPFGL